MLFFHSLLLGAAGFKGIIAAAVEPRDQTTLQYGTPESVGLLSTPFKELETNITAYQVARNYSASTHNEIHSIFSGATVIVGHQNVVVSHFATGKSYKYADVNGTELPSKDQIDTRDDTIYDMASLTKMFTTIIALQQLEIGEICLNCTVATYIPDFATNNKSNVTIEMLLTHTSGFDADPSPNLYNNYPKFFQKRQAIMEQALINSPGSTFLYSDLNFMNLQIVLETVTGQALDTLIAQNITIPLGMKDTKFNRGNYEGAWSKEDYKRLVATEYQIAALGPLEPQRPQPVRGSVHDENAWALHGVSGHAGLYSTAKDLAIFSQMILNNGTYGGARLLKPSTVDLIFTDFNARFAYEGDSHGLGFELNQNYWSGVMQSLQCAGHTGFTGTTMAIDRASDTFFILLMNRVHPTREWASPNIARRALGYYVAKSLGRNVTSCGAC